MTGTTRALRIVLALAILAALAKWVGPEGLIARVADCPWPAALAAFSTALLAQWLGAIRLWFLAGSQGLPLTHAQALGVNLSAVFYGLFLPGGSATGWAVRLFRLAPSASGVGTALVVLAGDRALTTATGAAIGVVAGIFMQEQTLPAVTALLAVIACGAGLLSVLLTTPAFDAWLTIANRTPGLRRVATYLTTAGTFACKPESRTIVLAILLSAALHAAGIAGWVVLARAVGLDIDAPAIAWVRSGAMVVTLMPATVGGLGFREGAVVYLMGGLGVAAVDALTLSLLAFALTVLAIGIVGGIVEASRLLTQRSAAPS